LLERSGGKNVGWSALLGGADIDCDVFDPWIIEQAPTKVKHLAIAVCGNKVPRLDRSNWSSTHLKREITAIVTVGIDLANTVIAGLGQDIDVRLLKLEWPDAVIPGISPQ
jgi:hypothetical protein